MLVTSIAICPCMYINNPKFLFFSIIMLTFRGKKVVGCNNYQSLGDVFHYSNLLGIALNVLLLNESIFNINIKYILLQRLQLSGWSVCFRSKKPQVRPLPGASILFMHLLKHTYLLHLIRCMYLIITQSKQTSTPLLFFISSKPISFTPNSQQFFCGQRFHVYFGHRQKSKLSISLFLFVVLVSSPLFFTLDIIETIFVFASFFPFVHIIQVHWVLFRTRILGSTNLDLNQLIYERCSQRYQQVELSNCWVR